MDSRTKNRQPLLIIKDMVAAAYGTSEVPLRSGSITELVHGWFNAVYLVRLRSGRPVVLKVAPDPAVEVLTYERELLLNEAAALRLLSESSVPAPSIHFLDATGAVTAAPWFFMDYIEGENFGALIEEQRLSVDRKTALMVQVGELNHRLNMIEGTRFGSLCERGAQNWATAFMKMVEDLLWDASRGGVRLDDLGERVRGAVHQHEALLNAVSRPKLVSWDLWPSNVIVRGDRVAGIIDHERSLWGDPLMEAGFMNAEVPIYPEAESFARGYRGTPLSEQQTLRRKLYSCHLLLVMMIEPAFRGVQDPKQAAWARHRLSLVLDSL